MFKLLKFNSKQLFIKSLIINTFVTLFTIILPYITKLFIDNIELKNGHKVLLFGLANILIVLGIQVLYYFADLFQGKSELFVWDNISQITHKNLQSYDPTQYDLSERNISQMLGQNYELLKHFFNQYPVMLTLYVVRAVAIIGILFSISPFIALLVLILIPFFMYISNRYGERLSSLGANMVNSMKTVREYLLDSSKLSLSERFFLKRSFIPFSTVLSAYKRDKMAQVKMTAFFDNFLSYAFLNLMISLSIIISGYLAFNGKITLGDLFAIQLYVSQFWTPVEYFVDVYKEYISCKQIMMDFITFLTPPLISYADVPIQSITINQYIGRNQQGANLHLPLSAKLQRGKAYIICGDNGVGKTKLILSLLGFDNDYSGELALAQITQNSNIAYCPADPIPSKFYDNKVSQGASMGQLKLFQLEQVLLQEKDVYIFDEPSNFLDQSKKKIIKEKIYALTNKHKIVVLVTHDADMFDSQAEKIEIKRAAK